MIVEDEEPNNELGGVEDELQGIGETENLGGGDTFKLPDGADFQQLGSRPGSLNGGSFVEGPQDDFGGFDKAIINAEDEFKTSEHDENEYQTVDDTRIKGQPANMDPLSNPEGTQNVMAELRRDP